MTHTPTPWTHHSGTMICDGKHSDLGGCQTIAEAEIIGIDSPTAKSNAEFIVEAVNSHEALVAALKGLHAAYIYNDGIVGDPYMKIQKLPPTKETWALWEDAAAALKAAGEL